MGKIIDIEEARQRLRPESREISLEEFEQWIKRMITSALGLPVDYIDREGS